MTEYIKLYKAGLVSTGNDYGVSGNTTVDLTENTTRIIQTVTNEYQFFDRMTTSTSKKPEKRAINRKKLTDKIVITGYLTRSDTEEPVTIKNKILALQQSVGLCDLYWREETFNGVVNPKQVSFVSAKFIDNREKPIASASGTASGGSTTTLVDSGIGWSTNQWVGKYVITTGGTGSGQVREIISNTIDTLTVATWTSPGADTTYIITGAKPNEVIYEFELQFIKAVSR